MGKLVGKGGALVAAVLLPALAASAVPMPPLECIIEPDMTIELSSAVDGVVSSVKVDKADTVRTGEVLATLEASVEEVAVAMARTRASQEEEIEAARIQRDLVESKKTRIAELYRKQSVPGFEKDEVEAQAALAELRLKQAISQQQLARFELQRAEADLKLRSILSPIDGIVVERYVNPGESVKDRPLLRLAKIDPLRVEIIADSQYFGTVHAGMAADVIIEGAKETRHRATVSVVDGVVDAASGTFSIRLTLPNPERTVVGGLKCRAQISAVMPN